MLGLWKWTLRIVVAVLIFFFAASWVFSPCRNQSRNQNYQKTENQSAESECATSGGILAAGVRNSFSWIGSIKPDEWTAFATVVMAVFTTILGIATWLLSEETKRLRHLAVEESNRTKEALAIAADQAKTAHDAFVASSRSWVFTQPWPHTATIDKATGNILFEMEIAFYGLAPATVTDLHVETASATPEGNPAYSLDKCFGMSLALAPGNKHLQRMPSGQFFETTFSKRCIFGFVRYQNKFGEFCSRYCAELEYLGRDEQERDRFRIVSVGTPTWSAFD